MADDLPKRGGAQTNFSSGLKDFIQICFREAKIFNRQGGIIFAALPHRIGLGKEMAPGPVGVN